MVSPLTPIGFELPRQQAATTPTPNLELPKAGTTGLAVLAQADQQFQRTLEAQSQSNQVAAKATSDIAQAQAASGTAISQAAAMASQVAYANSQRTVQSLAQLGSTIGEVTNRLAQERAAKAKAMQEAAKTAAIKELADAQIDWIEGGRIGKEGTTGYREAISAIMGKYSLGADDVSTLTERYYAPALDYAKSTEANRQKAADDVATQTRRIRVAGLQGKLSSALGGLAASAGLDDSVVQQQYEVISGAIGEYMANEEIPLLDRLTGAATAYESTNEVMSKRNADTSKIQADLGAFQKTAEYAVQLKERVLSGEMGITEYNNLVKLEAIKNGVPGFSTQDPNADNTYMTSVLSDQQKVRDLQQSAEMDALSNVAASDAIIGSLTTEFALNPRALAAAKATDPKKLDKNARAAIDLVEQFNKWKDSDVPQYNRRKAALQSDMVSIDKDFRTWLVNATNRSQAGSSSPGEQKRLEQLRAGGITVEAVQRGLTQEQTDQVRSATQDLLRAKQQEAAALDQEFSDAREKFAGVGLSTDTAAMKKNKAAYEETRRQYTLKLEQIKATKLNSYQAQPGQSPNFRGGAPGNPQAGRLSRSGNLTVPVAEGALVRSSPRGKTLSLTIMGNSPVASLVYGTAEVKGDGVVHVRGDDGFTYVYSGLSATSIVNGQRVGPSKALGVTAGGNTRQLVQTALSYVGKEFRPGEREQCANFVREALKQAGIVVGVTRQAIDGHETGPAMASSFFGADVGTIIKDKSQFQPGDLVAFGGTYGGYSADTITHVGIYTGNGMMVDRSTSSEPVRERPLTTFQHVLYAVRPKSGASSEVNVRVFEQSSGQEVDATQRLSMGEFGARARGVRTTSKGETPAAIPPNAIPLGRDTYLLDGKVIKATPTSLSSSNANYSGSSPLRSSYASNSKSSYIHDDTNAHGYDVFKRDPQFKSAVAKVASNLGIPPQWLADVIAYESAGTFKPNVTNPWGYTGLIQFGEAAAQDLGTSQAALAKMNPAQQMVYVEKYLRLQMRYAGVSKLEGPEYLVAAINQGHTVLRDVANRGAAAVLDPSNQDGAGVTLKYYMQNLGKYSGRKYNFKGNRQDRLRASVVHEHSTAGCAMCQNLSQQTAFIPHESEPIA